MVGLAQHALWVWMEGGNVVSHRTWLGNLG